MQILSRFHTAAGGLDEGGISKGIVSHRPDEIEISRVIYHDPPGDDTVMICIFQGPLFILKVKMKFLLLIHHIQPPMC